MARRVKERRDQTEMRPLINTDEDDEETDMDSIAHAGLSTAGDNQERPPRTSARHGKTYGTREDRHSKVSTERFRLIVLGGDDALRNKACNILIGNRQKQDNCRFKTCDLKEGQVNGRTISVLNTSSNWLERLKGRFFFNSKVESIRKEMEACEPLVFPGPHAFLLVLRDARNSGKEHRLLKALSKVFGEKALDYSFTLFLTDVNQSAADRNHSVTMCKNKYHILKNTDESVEEFLQYMTRMKYGKDFFTNHLDYFNKAKHYFQIEFEAEKKLNKEEVEKKEKQIKKMEIEHAETVRELKEARRNVTLLTEKLNCELNATRALQNTVEQLNASVQKLEKYWSDAPGQKTEMQSESKLTQKPQTIKKQSHEKERDLERRELSQREARFRGRSDYEHYSSMDLASSSERKDESEGEMEEVSQASGSKQFESSKRVRRNSKELEPPNLSESEHRPLHTLNRL